MEFYVDSCIYINLWRKEGNPAKGMPYWRIAELFFEQHPHDIIYFSRQLLKELKYKSPHFLDNIKLFSKPNFIELFSSSEEYALARKIEAETNFEISFYDIFHLLFARRTGAILITRDKKLMQIAKKYGVAVARPEEYVSFLR